MLLWHGSLAGAGVGRGDHFLDKECLTFRPRIVSGHPPPTTDVSRRKNRWESALPSSPWHHSGALRRGDILLCEESDDKQMNPDGNLNRLWSKDVTTRSTSYDTMNSHLTILKTVELTEIVQMKESGSKSAPGS